MRIERWRDPVTRQQEIPVVELTNSLISHLNSFRFLAQGGLIFSMKVEGY